MWPCQEEILRDLSCQVGRFGKKQTWYWRRKKRATGGRNCTRHAEVVSSEVATMVARRARFVRCRWRWRRATDGASGRRSSAPPRTSAGRASRAPSTATQNRKGTLGRCSRCLSPAVALRATCYRRWWRRLSRPSPSPSSSAPTVSIHHNISLTAIHKNTIVESQIR